MGSKEEWQKITIASAIPSSVKVYYDYDPAVGPVEDPAEEPTEKPSEYVPAPGEISVMLDGERIIFDQPPAMINDRTLVPLRAIFEKLGATVEWDDVNWAVTATKGDTVIYLKIDSNEMYINGNVKILDVPATLINSRTLVPVRAVSEAFDCNVGWDDPTQTVIITTK